jgi:hypothetical protein
LRPLFWLFGKSLRGRSKMQVNQLKVLILGLPLLLCTLAGLIGCASTSETKNLIFVDTTGDSLLRIGPETEGYVYFWNGKEWEKSSKKVKLPEGWLTGPPPKDK